MKKISIIKHIKLWVIVFLLVVGASMIALDLTITHNGFQSQVEQYRKQYIDQQKQMIKQEVDQVVAMIRWKKDRAEALVKAEIKSRVEEACAVCSHIYQLNKNRKSPAEIREMIIEALRPIRFAQGRGYYFITRLDGIEMLFADKPEFEGRNLLNMQDTQGKYVIKDMIKLVRQSGAGFYEYHWTKPRAAGKDYKKIAFVKRFAPLNWFIGTGLYVDDVERQIKNDLLTDISRIRFGREGYVFVDRLNGDVLVANGRRFDGTRKLWQVFKGKPVKIKAVFAKERRAALKDGGDYIYYTWGKLSDPDREAAKASFVYGIPELQWLVGAGVYLDDVEMAIAQMHFRLQNQLKIKILIFILCLLAMIALFLLLFNHLHRQLKNDFRLFNLFFDRAAHSDEPINQDLIRFSEFDRLAEHANKMLFDKTLARQKLFAEQQALRESEQKFREMANLLPQVVYEADARGNISFINRQSLEMFGYSEADADERLSFFTMLVPEDRSRAEENIEAVLAGKTPGNNEYTALRKDGSVFPVMAYSTPVYHDGKLDGFRGIIVDISERKRMEEELLKVRKLESVGVLAGGIAHDFNNILTAILGNISLALINTDPENENHALLLESEKASLRAQELTQQLLTFAKGGEPVKKIAAIDEVIKDSAGFVLRGSNVRCDFQFSEDLWPVVLDAGQISQVIQNIIINAAQAMPGGGRIVIFCTNCNLNLNSVVPVSPGNYIKIIIKDQGIGIPADMLDKIFDPYFTTKQQGSGLGLAITHSIIKKHKGYLAVDSRLGQGTTFTIYLPAAQNKTGSETRDVIAAPLPCSGRIMIMDDEETIRALLSRTLSRAGYEVVAVNDGEQAVLLYKKALAAEQSIDLVIMDLTIPGGMGGKDAVREILKINPEAKVAVSSGYSNDPVIANFSEYGFCGALGKPFKVSRVLEFVAQVLNG